MRYPSNAHVPRSVSWQRSEQNGRQVLFSHNVGWRQVGHFILHHSILATEESGGWLVLQSGARRNNAQQTFETMAVKIRQIEEFHSELPMPCPADCARIDGDRRS
jgi:hypothetical protein